MDINFVPTKNETMYKNLDNKPKTFKELHITAKLISYIQNKPKPSDNASKY